MKAERWMKEERRVLGTLDTSIADLRFQNADCKTQNLYSSVRLYKSVMGLQGSCCRIFGLSAS